MKPDTQNMHYDIIMITTFVENDYIEGLLRSVIQSNHAIDVMLVVVDQMAGPILLASDNPRVRIEWLRAKGPLSLSRARNVALEHIKRSDVRATHYMFPDDDVTFDRHFFDNYTNVVKPDTSYLTVIYNEGSEDYFHSFPREDMKRLGPSHFEYSSSVNLIVTQEACEKTGPFDERLGVGAEYGAEEDHDFFIRACEHTPFEFTGRLHVFHPATKGQFSAIPVKALLRRYASYGRAHIYLVYRHRMFWRAPKSVARAFAASGYCLAALQWKRSLVQLYAGFIRLWYSLLFLVRYKRLFDQKRG